MYGTVFWTLWEKARVGYFKRTASKHVYYLGWNRSPAQVGCMRQALGPGALGRPRGIRWRGRWEGGSGWGTHVNPWLIHFNVWQNPLQLKKKSEKNKKTTNSDFFLFNSSLFPSSHCVVSNEKKLATLSAFCLDVQVLLSIQLSDAILLYTAIYDGILGSLGYNPR